jgi:pyruvate kinase
VKEFDELLPTQRRFASTMLSKIRRTKIVCTIGPATSNRRIIEKLARAGMDCARLNFSHGNPAEHLRVIREVREISKRLRSPIAIMQDLPGPKIRVGKIAGGSVELRKGATVALTTSETVGDSHKLPVGPKDLPKYVLPGSTIFLSDGSIRLRVTETTDTDIICKCEIGGLLLSGKGVNIPQLKQTFETFTDRDKEFLSFGLEQGIDFVAVSFVRTAKDIRTVQSFIRERSSENKAPLVVAKIEKKDAISNLDEIVRESDAVMVARGDLGVENPVEEVPILQKMVISKCNANAVPVITATQILESMVTNPSPTRAEVSDIANAIFDGTDALMLSEETAVGKYPIECVQVLDRVSLIAEEQLLSKASGSNLEAPSFGRVQDAVSKAVSQISVDVQAKAIVSPLDDGELIQKISRFRQGPVIVGISDQERILRRGKIIWGLSPVRTRKTITSLRDLLDASVEALLKEKIIKTGDRIVAVRDKLKLSRQTGIMLFVAEATGKERKAQTLAG